jgi:hypothetical protein
VLVMTAARAREATAELRATLDHAWELALEAYEGKVWLALDYDSWRGWWAGEFGLSQSRGYQLLDQGRVIRELQEASGSTMVEIGERDARAIKPVIDDVVEDVVQRVEAGEDAQAAVDAAVQTVHDVQLLPGRHARRGPLTDDAQSAVLALQRAARRVIRIVDDDRFGRNREALLRYGPELVRVEQDVRKFLDALDPNGELDRHDAPRAGETGGDDAHVTPASSSAARARIRSRTAGGASHSDGMRFP